LRGCLLSTKVRASATAQAGRRRCGLYLIVRGLHVEPIRLAYGVANAGINALIRHVASRWGKEGIRANSIASGFVLTEAATDNVSEEEGKAGGPGNSQR